MIFKNIRPFEVEPFKNVNLNMLFRVEVLTGSMYTHGPLYLGDGLMWVTDNPHPDKPAVIRLFDMYGVFTTTLLESAQFKVELAKWFNGVVDDILDSGEGAWETGMVTAYFKTNHQPQSCGPTPHPQSPPSPFDLMDRLTSK